MASPRLLQPYVDRGEYIPGDQYLMHDLPGTLMEEVKISECHEMWDNVPFLHDLDPKFLRCLALKTSTYLFGPGDFILYHGDMGREMYCIRKGNVEVSPLCSCVRVCMCVHVYVCTCECIYTQGCVCVYLRAFNCAFNCACMCMLTCVLWLVIVQGTCKTTKPCTKSYKQLAVARKQ